jgi:DNA-directed RNA polymerase subunit RPC12/RpoP
MNSAKILFPLLKLQSNIREVHKAMDEMLDDLMDDDFRKDKIYCANCSNCVLVKERTGMANQYVLRVRCIEKKWKKKLGEEKLYKYFTVARRTVDECDVYNPMGELKSFLKDLRKSLPIKDEIYKDQIVAK